MDPYLKPLKKQHLFRQINELLRAEELFLQAIKVSERELNDILNLRKTEEHQVDLAISIYDTIRNESVNKFMTIENSSG